MKIGQEGPTVSRAPGDVLDIEDAEAGRMIDAGIAERADKPAAPQTATKKAPARRAATTG